jgi:hypothetical protein
VIPPFFWGAAANHWFALGLLESLFGYFNAFSTPWNFTCPPGNLIAGVALQTCSMFGNTVDAVLCDIQFGCASASGGGLAPAWSGVLDAGSQSITETNRRQLVLTGMHNRTFGQCLAAINSILISLMEGRDASQRMAARLQQWMCLQQWSCWQSPFPVVLLINALVVLLAFSALRLALAGIHH